jgi:ribonuclease E
MAKRMLIDATHPEETRVVVVSGTRLEELDVETSTKKQLKGNIYLAKVVRVEPSLQAAFVDYGGNRHGFLAFNEIHPDYYQIPVADRQRLLAEERAVFNRSHDGENGHAAGEGAAEAAHGEGGEGQPVESVDVVGGDDDDMERRRPKPSRNYKIQEVIKRRQIMLVQVVKEERGNKGAALTTYLSLAGRYCVLMPNTARGGGVSRKITNAVDRKRLKSIASELEIPDGMAMIVRTAGSERTKAEIKRDYEYLLRLWDDIREKTLKSVAPALTYEEANLIKRAIRDLYSRDIEDILVDGEEGYRAAKDFMRMLTPSHAKRVQPYRDPTMPLFYRFQIENQLDAMHSPVVQLKSGGYIVISQTEALVAIDVNSGRATKERHIEETALKTNLEASDEIARQLRLRDLAGLVVIDFIDMEENRNNHAVERRLKEAMKNDRARIQLGRISPFGLLELSRQRLRPSLQETTFQPCQHCGGTGQVRSVESAAVYVLRAIEEEGIRRRSSEVTVTVPTAVALYILNQKRSALAEIEATYEFRVLLTGDDSLIPPAYRMDRVRAELRPDEAPRPVEAVPSLPPPIAIDDEEEPEVEEEETAEAAEAGDTGEAQRTSEGSGGGDQPRRKRRRRKRRRRGDEAVGAEAAGEDGEAEGDESDSDEGEAAEGEGAEADDEESQEAATAEAGSPDTGEQPRKRRRGKRGGRRRRREGAEGLEGAEAVDVGSEEPVETEGMEADADEGVMPAAAEQAEEAEQAPAAAAIVIEAPAVEVGESVLPVVDAPEQLVAEQPAAGQVEEAPVKKPRSRRKKAEAAETPAPAEAVAEVTAKAPRKSRSRKAVAAPAAEEAVAAEAPAAKPPAAKAPRSRRKKAEPAEVVAEPTTVEVEVTPAAAEMATDAVPAAPEVAEERVPLPAEEAPASEPAGGPTAAPEDKPAEPQSSVTTDLPDDATPRRGWWRR